MTVRPAAVVTAAEIRGTAVSDLAPFGLTAADIAKIAAARESREAEREIERRRAKESRDRRSAETLERKRNAS